MSSPVDTTHSCVFRTFAKRGFALCLIVIASITCSSLCVAQSTPRRRLLTAAVDENSLTVLHGNTYPLARAEFDRGPAPPSLPMQRMVLVLKRSAEQAVALESLLDQQQDKASPNYHKWLVPTEFGQQFGPADEDVQVITSWLQSHGFEVERVSNGRTVIEFSGTVEQVSSAFHTEIHKYLVNGKDRWGNASDPQIPMTLAPAVAGILTLHNFPRKWMHHLGGVYTRSKDTGRAESASVNSAPATLFTLSAPNGCGVQRSDCYALSPYDFGIIYDVVPLWNATPTHIDGTGEIIAVVAESNINLHDVASFRSYFGLPTPPKVNVIVNGPDPGLDPGGAETEADLDVEWSGAIAPNATIDLVVTQSTESSLGADLSALYVVDNNLAPVMNVSFGICELGLGTTGNQFFNQLWQQAAAQGITVLVSTGDSGAAVCDRGDGPPPAPAVFGLTVSGFSSTPYNVAVGGTDFNDLTNASTFWNLTNTPPPNNPSAPPTFSAKSYIPETTWNNSCTNGVFGLLLGFSPNAEVNCNNPQLTHFVTSVGGSGGKSNCTTSDGQHVSSCTGGYAKPSWQVGVGVPNDGGRDVPDVSLFSAAGSPSGSFYVVCEADALPPGFTSCDPTDPGTGFLSIGGTSASSPTLAAMIALVNQKTNSRQGNANYVLYKLAAQQPTAFHDVPVGGTIAMPCANGSPNCTITNVADAYGVLSGFSTTAGYDLATGLGSLDANNLVTSWNSITTLGSNTTLQLSPSPVNITHGQSVNVAIAVTAAQAGGQPPTGNVSLIANTGSSGQQGVEAFALTNGLVSGSTSSLPGGTYTVAAHYPGDGNFGASDSTPPVSVTVNSESSKTFANLVTFDGNGNVTSYSASSATYGQAGGWRLRVDVGDAGATLSPLTGIASNCSTSVTNCPTGTINLTSNGAPLDGGTLSLNSKGYAEDQSLPTGSYAVSAVYSGDSSYKASMASANFSVNKSPTTVEAGSLAAAASYGINQQIAAAILTTSRGVAPTGTVSFTLDGSPLPTNAMSYEGFPYEPTNSPPSFATLSGTGLAQFLSLGNHNLVAQYSGDTNYSAGTSAPVTITVNKALPFFESVGAVPTTASVNQQVSLEVRLFGSDAGVAPSGTFTFSDNGSAISGPVTYVPVPPAPLTISALNATMPYAPSTVGVHTISVSYSGDSNFLSVAASAASSANLTVIGPDFSIAANPSLILISQPGASGTTTLTFSAMNGLSGTFNLVPQCAGLPSESSCSVSPSSITLNSGAPTATITLTVATMAPSHADTVVRSRPMGPRIGVFLAIGLLVLVWLLNLLYKQRNVRFALPLLVFIVLLMFAACGGGGGGAGAGGGGGSGGNPGTPVGLDSNASVTFSFGSTSHAIPLQINVE